MEVCAPTTAQQTITDKTPNKQMSKNSAPQAEEKSWPSSFFTRQVGYQFWLNLVIVFLWPVNCLASGLVAEPYPYVR